MDLNNKLILFQGDSVTDVQRDRINTLDLGGGYPLKIYEKLKNNYKNIRVLNRGVSGDTSKLMMERWDEDTIKINPDILNILIGVNDTWRRYDSAKPTSTKEFEHNLEEIINMTTSQIDSKIILCNPFILEFDANMKKMKYEDLVFKQNAVKNVAAKFSIPFIDFQKALDEETFGKNLLDYSIEGIHPLEKGHEVLANYWIEKIKEL